MKDYVGRGRFLGRDGILTSSPFFFDLGHLLVEVFVGNRQHFAVDTLLFRQALVQSVKLGSVERTGCLDLDSGRGLLVFLIVSDFDFRRSGRNRCLWNALRASFGSFGAESTKQRKVEIYEN